MYNPFSLEGRTILVTGASSGIGKATAIECSKMGAKVIISARNIERLSQTYSELEGEGHQMIICDLNSEESIEKLVSSISEIDGLVNNAGFTIAKPVKFINAQDLKDLLNVNTVAPIVLLRYLLKKKKIKSGSSVVFTSSVAGQGKSVVGNTMYSSSKGAICAFVSCCALELAKNGIRVNSVCPGMVETNILKSGDITEEQVELDKQNYPLKRYGKPEEVAWAMIYLLSEASNWVTGTNLIIDGGWTIR